jgi:hypothetical protein
VILLNTVKTVKAGLDGNVIRLPDSDACGHVLLDGSDRLVDVGVRVVEVRREPQAGTILAAARRAADSVLLVKRRRQLADVEIPGLEREDRRAS